MTQILSATSSTPSKWAVKDKKVTPAMRANAREIADYWRRKYKEEGDKVGRIKCECEFEEYEVHLPVTNDKGQQVITTASPVDHIEIECVLYVHVPVLGMGFDFTDKFTYRWRNDTQEFEYEEGTCY